MVLQEDSFGEPACHYAGCFFNLAERNWNHQPRFRQEKENLIRRLREEGKQVAVIARLVGLTRKTVYKALKSEAGVAR